MGFKQDCVQLLKPYYIFNIFLSLSYIVARKTPGMCNYLFSLDDCEFDGRETQILFFLMIVIMIRSRKTGSVTMINYLSSSFIYTKVANLILWGTADFAMGAIYAIIFVLMGLLLPEPTYKGPENIIYFNGAGSLAEELSRDTRTTWVIAFFTVWNPACSNFAPIFSKISAQFGGLDNLKFGKVDVGRYPDAGRKYNISDSSYSKQLPTIILFKDSKEVERRPLIDKKCKILSFLFSDENIKATFDLKNLYDECKNDLKERNKLKLKNKTKSD